MIISKSLPIQLQSPNVQEHWTKKQKRNHVHALLIKQHMLRDVTEIGLPCKITLERSGKRLMDYDNYVFSCKGIRYTLAQFIFQKRRGIGDNDPRIEWIYKQIKGDISLRIEIEWEDGRE